MTDKIKNMLVRTVTGVLFVAALVTSFLRFEAMVFLFAIITGLTLWEYATIVNTMKAVRINRFISTAAGVYFFLAVAGYCSGITPSAVFIPYLLTVVYLFVSELYTRHEHAINDWAYTMLSQMYIALPFAMLNVLAFQSSDDGIRYCRILPLSIFIFLWTSDTGAYCVGSLLGRHKLFPRISPAKSWEGSLGGAILVLIAASLISQLIDDASILTLYEWLGLGLVVTIFGTWGDLVESLFKRTVGIKDSGNILPGHGGMLDRFDSALMAIPAAVVYLYTLTLI
ncbi:phosphatidate cytidylyltransferase [Hoylesella marshii]|uniref:Phosphatidate cytidylyltransferase n=1 Tax=Hoylesella marshii DSM 16973 = JCM 13450 TaxID=862515 RepID=E0NVT7_9BACT|nr:phosphatidate cytidylyltransferase [Hoylesella marshii]EFM00769.1 phosphatidate cytidylyltransferase [Hoylesella marshii DSM 16973 = JCM 13450]